MASSSERWLLACDTCDARGSIGPRAANAPEASGRDAWCEACQLGAVVASGAETALCARCGGPLSIEAPRFLEAWGAIQDLAAVLAAAAGDPAPLRALLPERPRFLTDLDPPDADSGDDPEAAGALARLAAGDFAGAQPGLRAWTARRPAEARAFAALAIADERRGETTAAEEAWSRSLEAADTARARLARGALRARRGAWSEALEDLARAGDGREARWNRAAVRIARAVEITPGLPGAEVIAAAREEAGPPSEYWSDFTIGRLLWTLVVERAQSRRGAGASVCPDERVVRAAALEFEHDTFWDRAMVLAGFATLGMAREAREAGFPVAEERIRALADEPFLRAPGAEPIRERVESARSRIATGDLAGAVRDLRTLLDREDLRQYAVPCAACGRGRLRAEAIEEAGAEDEPGRAG